MDTSSKRPQVIRCLNVKFSPNLGDGLLSECLEAALIRHGADHQTASIDLAARTAYGQQMTGRGTIMRVLDALPPALRQQAVRLPLRIQSQRKWAPHYAQNLEGAQAVAIGGGNLITDLDLNFPTKLSLAMQRAQAGGLSAAIFACGMGGTWTREGLVRLKNAFGRDNLRAVFLRDQASKEIWDTLMAQVSGHEATVVRDPGLLACETYVQPPKTPRAKPQIGLGIMSDIAIRYHSATTLQRGTLGQWYLDLTKVLVGKGADVVAFTNGSPEDVEMADSLAPDLCAIGRGTVRTAAPATPTELAGLIASFDALAAYRMHAIIAAYSFGVPGLALAWDVKVKSFMESVERGAWLRELPSLPAEEAADLLLTLAQEGQDMIKHKSVIEQANQDVGVLLKTLTT